MHIGHPDSKFTIRKSMPDALSKIKVLTRKYLFPSSSELSSPTSPTLHLYCEVY